MENNKSRTDMLAAGRKKLQQFRKKKGGGTPNLAKPGNENEIEEPSKFDQSDLLPDQFPSGLDIQEAQGDSLSNIQSSGVGHDLDSNSSSGVNHEVSGPSSSSEIVHERGDDPTVSCVNLETELTENEDGGDHLMGKGSSEEETSSDHKPVVVEEANGSTSLADGIQDSMSNTSFLENMEKDTYPEQNLKGFVSLSAAISHEEVYVGIGVESITSDREEEYDHDQQVFVDNLKTNTDPAEEYQTACLDISHESKEDTSLEKEIEITSQEISVIDEEFQGGRASDRGVEYYSPTEILYGKDECHCKQPEEVVYVKGIDVDDQEGIPSLQEYRMKGSSIEGQIEPDGMAMNGNSVLELESFKRHLYESYVEKDILQLLLVDQSQLNENFHHHSSFEGHKPFNLVNDEMGNNCTSERKEIEQEHVELCEFKSEHHKSREVPLDLSKELDICRRTLDDLQMENSTLIANLISETDARKKLVEEVEILSSEKMKLASALMVETDATTRMAEQRELLSNENMFLLSELKAKEEKLQIALEREVKLQDSLRESGSCFEQLLEENIYLTCSLDMHKAKLKEIRSWMFESNFNGQEGQISNCELTNCTAGISQTFYEESNLNVSSSKNLKSSSLGEEDVSLLRKVDGEVSDSHALLNVLKEQLQEAKSKLQGLEQSIQGMHSHSLSLIKPGGSPTTAGVSKLIKAFESKSNHIGSDEDEVPLIVTGRTDDSYTLSIEQTLSLHNILNTMELKLESVEIHVMGNPNNKEFLEKLEMDCQYQKHQNNSLQLAFDELANKMVSYDLQMQETLKHIDGLHQHVNEDAAGFLNRIEFLKGEVSEDVFALKQERDIVYGIILEVVGKLDACTGLNVLEDFDARSHVMASVDTAILSIKNLHGKLEEINQNYKTLQDSHEGLNRSFMDIQGKHSLAIQLFFKFYSNLMELKNGAQHDAGHADFDEMLESLPGKCEMFVSYLRELLSERVYLLSRNKELDLDLSTRNHEIEELTTQLKELDIIRGELESTLLIQTNEIEEVKGRCLILANKLKEQESSKDLYGYSNSCERGELAVTEDADDVDHSCNSVLLCLEESVASHLHNYEEIVEEIILSRKNLHDADMLVEISLDDCFIRLPTLLSQVVIPKVIKLHENQKLLTVSIVEKDSEIQISKESRRKLEDALEASYTELQLKSSEIEQLEQKLSSVREKLSLAVAKGKGLLLQRDSLKQALMERSSELEKSTQDLLLKEGLLEELEVKLKSCSDVERIEALESELSYIRNSATALRDSFLQKDSMLQRIEELLEDLDLPDDFQDKDILEKIELLFRFASVHPSSTLTGLEQKNLEDHAHSDSGEGTANNSNPDFDELKRKLEEMQGNFYNLAEQNDMLEQSLLERNNLVHKWEEILGRIDLPSHMQTMEPEDKIEWLEKELSEVKQERDALQLKIDNLEISSDMLIGDVEESHKKLSEFAAEIVAVKSDREFFSESLENLRFEYLALSEKAIHDERDRESLLKELYDLQEKLIGNAQFEYYKGMENSLQRSYDLINSTLTECDKVDFLSGCNLAENLENSLKVLTDIYAAHINKSSNTVQDNEALFTETSAYHGKMVPEDALLDKESDLASMKLELDLAFKKLASVVHERNTIFVNCESLILEIVDLNMQVHLLNMEKHEDLGKYQSVMLELDAVSKQRDFVQEQFTQEEKKSASFKEKLNLAVRKGKGLVQQRDSLKQTVDELNASLEQLKINHSQQTEALMSEKSLFMNQLAEMELNLQDKNQNYSKLLTAVQAIDLEGEDNEADPVEKLRMVSSSILDVRSQAAAAELEANKSKLAAELLLAELNEIQERNDFLQEELVKKEASLVEYSAQKDESLSRLEHFMSVYTAERGRISNNLVDFMSGIDRLKEGLLWSSRILPKVLNKDVDLLHYLEDFKEFSFDAFGSPDQNNQPSLLSNIVSSKDEDISWPSFDIAQYQMHQHLDENSLFEYFAFAIQTLHQCISHIDELREHICKHSVLLDKKKVYLSETIDAIKRKNSTFKDASESLSRDIKHLESKLKEKDAKISSLYGNLTLLYEACSTSIFEAVSRKSQITGNSPTVGEDFVNSGIVWKLPSYANLEKDENVHSINDYIKMMAESILSTMKDATCTNELVERTKTELKDTVLALQRELHEKDIQLTKVCEELVIQIRDAEAVAKKSMSDLDSSRAQVSILEKKAEAMEADRNSLELRLKELHDVEALSKLLQERINTLTDTINAKDQENESLMQALDEQESQIEALVRNNKDMENIVQQRTMQLESLEASHTKSMSKLSTTVSKFDELHNLSETLLAEIESLQSQLQKRDSEISFLRQEVTRCTNDVLASQETSKNYSSEARELLTWMNNMASRIGGTPLQFNDQEASPIRPCIDIVGEKIASAITELEELRVNVQSKDALLETERGKVQELLLKVEDIETSLHGKAKLEQSQGSRAFEKQLNSNLSGALEIEQMVQRNKVSSGPIATHVRSGRKANNDHIAIAIDSENRGLLDDEDDDKSHGFKSLAMSRLVPRATRPIADRIDGIWVSAERLMMRQPALRLAFLMYWIGLHALLASFV